MQQPLVAGLRAVRQAAEGQQGALCFLSLCQSLCQQVSSRVYDLGSGDLGFRQGAWRSRSQQSHRTWLTS